MPYANCSCGNGAFAPLPASSESNRNQRSQNLSHSVLVLLMSHIVVRLLMSLDFISGSQLPFMKTIRAPNSSQKAVIFVVDLNILSFVGVFSLTIVDVVLSLSNQFRVNTNLLISGVLHVLARNLRHFANKFMAKNGCQRTNDFNSISISISFCHLLTLLAGHSFFLVLQSRFLDFNWSFCQSIQFFVFLDSGSLSLFSIMGHVSIVSLFEARGGV